MKHRKHSVVVLTSLVCVGVGILPVPAEASVGPLGLSGVLGGGLTGTNSAVNSVSSTTTSSPSNLLSNTVGTVSNTVSTVTNTLGSTTNTLTNTVNSTTNSLTGTVGTTTNSLLNTVNSAANTVTNAVGSTTNSLASTVDGTAGTATGTVDNVLNSVTGSTGNLGGLGTGGLDPAGSMPITKGEGQAGQSGHNLLPLGGATKNPASSTTPSTQGNLGTQQTSNPSSHGGSSTMIGTDSLQELSPNAQTPGGNALDYVLPRSSSGDALLIGFGVLACVLGILGYLKARKHRRAS